MICIVSLHDFKADNVIEVAAKELEKELEVPDWSLFVKTGVSKERPPEDANWWFMRAASLLRRIYLDGPIGVSKLRSYYGGRQRRGHGPAHFKKGGGKIIRTILQQLEEKGYVKKEKKGRIVTPKGQSFLDTVVKRDE